MRRSPIKRFTTGTQKQDVIKKPFGFCCDVRDQDPESRYDKRRPAFQSSLTNIVLDNGGPDIKFRIQDIKRPLFFSQRIGGFKTTTKDPYFVLGSCKRCRGPLKWYLEDEIAAARDIMANERQTEHNSETKKNIKIAKEKAAKQHRESKKKNFTLKDGMIMNHESNLSNKNKKT